MASVSTVGYVKVDGGHLGYTRLGNAPGPPVVGFVGGTMSATSLLEEPRAARLIRRSAMFVARVTYDRRGIGLSDPLPAGLTPTVEQQAADMLSLLDALELDKVVLWGTALDGHTAMYVAAHHPHRVEKLILMSTTACPMSKPDYPHGLAPELIAGVLATVSSPGTEFEGARLTDLLAPSTPGDAQLAAWFDTAGRASPAVARAYFEASMSADVRGILPMITAPTLIMHNTGDRWIGIDNARYLATHIPNATLKEYDSPDHFVFLGHQDQKLADMEEFICGSTQVASTRLLLTVLFTDVVGSTQRLSVARDRNWHADLDEIDVDVERVTRQHGGRVCKRMGDGHLLVFERPSDAASAALALIDTLATMEVDIRAGMHFGEVEVRGDDVAGMAVHIAARVSGQAAAGQLLATSTVVELITGSPFVSEDIGERELKGVPGARHLFDITRGAR